MIKSTFPVGYGQHQFFIKCHIFYKKSWEVVKNTRFHSVNMTCRSILVFEISARNAQFLTEIVGSGKNIRFPSVNMTWRSILVFEISARYVQFLVKNIRFHSVNMTCRSILVLRFLLEMFSFCQKSWEVVKNIRFLSVNMTCRPILVFEISTRNVQFSSEILGSGQKHKVSFGKYDMTINSRF